MEVWTTVWHQRKILYINSYRLLCVCFFLWKVWVLQFMYDQNTKFLLCGTSVRISPTVRFVFVETVIHHFSALLSRFTKDHRLKRNRLVSQDQQAGVTLVRFPTASGKLATRTEVRALCILWLWLQSIADFYVRLSKLLPHKPTLGWLITRRLIHPFQD